MEVEFIHRIDINFSERYDVTMELAIYINNTVLSHCMTKVYTSCFSLKYSYRLKDRHYLSYNLNNLIKSGVLLIKK